MIQKQYFFASSFALLCAFGCGSGSDDLAQPSGGGPGSGGLGSGGSASGALGSGGPGSGGLSSGGAGSGGLGAGIGGLGAGGGGGPTGGSSTGGALGSTGGQEGVTGGTGNGGSTGLGGGAASGGSTTASGGGASTSCEFTVSKKEVSSKMATVGVVEWSLAGGAPTSAKIVFALKDAATTVLNKGGEARVDLTKTNYRTLLLGLKQSKDYTFRIEAVTSAGSCVSDDMALPKTGALSGAPTVSVNVAAADKRTPGFIVTSTGLGGGGGIGGGGASSAYIIDADGEIVWYSAAPASASRALMDYEGENMWMLALNVQNSGGEMRYMSMDGQTSKNNVDGLSKAHHDFTVMPGGKVAAMIWRTTGMDPESDLVIRSPDGTLTTPFKIGSNLYSSSSFHSNAIHYIPADDSFTISDRNPNLYVKVSSSGQVQWQIGGSCTNAPAGSNCSPQSWKVNHGHHLLEDGSFVLFNNGTSGNAHIFEFDVAASGSPFAATLVKDYTGTVTSNVLGDVQRLPGGNTLISYSTSAKIVELDSSWGIVQTFSGGGGYSSWRPSLYGPPTRL